MMKYYVSVVLIAILAETMAISDEFKNMLQTLHDTCVPAVGVSEDVLIRARKGDFDDDDKLKCYMRCLFQQLEGLDSDGKVKIDHLITHLPDEFRDALTPIIRKCGVLVGSNECETAFMFCKCSFDQDPSLFFLP
uniref:Odorant binding protein 4 n=1 Tax=Xylotrechus quadripes TaxID=554073 RepID=A0A346HGM6_9CUCU|nr:odorant binding protein 4 [Xylotrechus quadripes]